MPLSELAGLLAELVGETPLSELAGLLAESVSETPLSELAGLLGESVSETPLSELAGLLAELVGDTVLSELAGPFAELVGARPLSELAGLLPELIGNGPSSIAEGPRPELVGAEHESELGGRRAERFGCCSVLEGVRWGPGGLDAELVGVACGGSVWMRTLDALPIDASRATLRATRSAGGGPGCDSRGGGAMTKSMVGMGSMRPSSIAPFSDAPIATAPSVSSWREVVRPRIEDTVSRRSGIWDSPPVTCTKSSWLLVAFASVRAWVHASRSRSSVGSISAWSC